MGETRRTTEAGARNAEDWRRLDPGFVRRTYRSTAVITGFTCLMLASRNLMWAVVPVFAGSILSLSVFWLNETGFKRLFAPHGAETEGKDREAKKRARATRLRRLSLIAALKYVLVGVLVAVAVRFWNIAQIAAFAGGFCLIHVSIVLRVISRLMLARMNESNK